MDVQRTIAQIDLNRGLRDRLGDQIESDASVDHAAELTLAVKDLQDLVRSRLAP
jgi:hypothetical protein